MGLGGCNSDSKGFAAYSVTESPFIWLDLELAAPLCDRASAICGKLTKTTPMARAWGRLGKDRHKRYHNGWKDG